MAAKRNSVSGSSRRKAKVDLSNGYGFNIGKLNTTSAVTQGKPSNKNNTAALKRKIRD